MKILIAILIFLSMFNFTITWSYGNGSIKKKKEYHAIFSILAFILFLIFF
jgi:hypothetical protein